MGIFKDSLLFNWQKFKELFPEEVKLRIRFSLNEYSAPVDHL